MWTGRIICCPRRYVVRRLLDEVLHEHRPRVCLTIENHSPYVTISMIQTEKKDGSLRQCLVTSRYPKELDPSLRSTEVLDACLSRFVRTGGETDLRVRLHWHLTCLPDGSRFLTRLQDEICCFELRVPESSLSKTEAYHSTARTSEEDRYKNGTGMVKTHGSP